jgi:hypothetical protein
MASVAGDPSDEDVVSAVGAFPPTRPKNFNMLTDKEGRFVISQGHYWTARDPVKLLLVHTETTVFILIRG